MKSVSQLASSIQKSEDWKYFLRGALLDKADFACGGAEESLANKMVYDCLISNVSVEETKAEVRRYLQSQRATELFIETSIEDVEEFCKKFKPNMKKEKAWLITWQWLDDDDKVIEEALIGLRRPRLESDKIEEFIQQHYMASYFSPAAKLLFATSSRQTLDCNPYHFEYPAGRRKI